VLRLGAALCGAGIALLYFSLIVWTARDVAARSRDTIVRIAAILLVIFLNVFGLVVYLMLRPRETIAERYERELIEEILARELSSRRAASSATVFPASENDA
jgi:heme/copper-type cytochrome/quinol oxidase subunit 2